MVWLYVCVRAHMWVFCLCLYETQTGSKRDSHVSVCLWNREWDQLRQIQRTCHHLSLCTECVQFRNGSDIYIISTRLQKKSEHVRIDHELLCTGLRNRSMIFLSTVRWKFTQVTSGLRSCRSVYLFSNICTHSTRLKSEAISLTSHRVFILKIYLILTP